MKFSATFQRRACWLNLPTAVLLLILQRMPVVGVIAAEEMAITSPIGALLKLAVATVATLGAVNTMVGATPLVPTTGTASGITVTVGTPVSVQYTVNGTQTPPLSWDISGNIPPGLDFSGRTTPGTVNIGTLQLSGTPTTAGSFAVTIHAFEFANGGGISSPAYNYTITVNAGGGGGGGGGAGNVAPSITTQPDSQTVTAGGSVTFTAAAAGTPTPTFQWRKGGTNISGATNASLTLASVVAGDAGDYTIVATNSQGSVTSNVATLTVSAVLSAPAFTKQPASQTASTGGSVTFSVTATGNPAPTYQWRKGGTSIAGATSSSFAINSVLSTDAGDYTVVATNSQGTATSTVATLTIGIAASHQPVNATVSTGFSASFSAGNSAGTIQWQVSSDNGATWSNLSDNATYTGTHAATLVVHNASSALNNSRYRYTATNNGVVATSNGAILAVAQVFFPFPTAIATDASGTLYVADANVNTVQKVSGSNQVSLLAGTQGTAGSTDGTGSTARFNMPAGLALGAGGVAFIADTANATIRRIGADGAVTTLAGSSTVRGSADGTGSAATFSSPNSLVVDGSGNLFVADAMNNTIRKVTSAGAVTTFAGAAGVSGSADGAGGAARFNLPLGLALDGSGNLYVADTTNNAIRKITPAGNVSTFAGLPGVSGSQDGTGTGAFFNHPNGLAVDGSGNVFVADTGNSTIRKISAGGTVTTLAGLAGIAGLMDGSGSDSFFNQPQSLAIDASGNLYVADTGNAALRKVTSAGVVTTLVLSAQPAPAPTPAPTTPTPTPTPAPSGGGGGGGGGGGAPSEWFVGVLLLLVGTRLLRRKS